MLLLVKMVDNRRKWDRGGAVVKSKGAGVHPVIVSGKARGFAGKDWCDYF